MFLSRSLCFLLILIPWIKALQKKRRIRHRRHQWQESMQFSNTKMTNATTQPSTSCSHIGLILRTDSHPEETQVSLRRVDIEPITVLWKYLNLLRNQEFWFTACVDPDSCHELKISDVDGICCSYGFGGYQAFWRGEEVAKGGTFTKEFKILLGNCSSN
jgi:hypothetical protein